MKSINKIIIIFTVAVSCSFFLGCQTTENIVVLNSNIGNNLFLRNTILKTKDSNLKSVEIDITVNSNKSEILKNPIINYTLKFSSSGYDKTDSISLFLENNGSRYFVINTNTLFKEITKNRDLNIRFTSEIPTEDFKKICSNYLPVKVGLILKDGSEIVLSSKEIDTKFNDLRVILN